MLQEEDDKQEVDHRVSPHQVVLPIHPVQSIC